MAEAGREAPQENFRLVPDGWSDSSDEDCDAAELQPPVPVNAEKRDAAELQQPQLSAEMNAKKHDAPELQPPAPAPTNSEKRDATELSPSAAPKKAKRMQLSLRSKKRKVVEVNDENCWTFLSESDASSLAKKCVPKSTATNTKWALCNFMAWRSSLNKGFEDPEKQVPSDILESSVV